MLAHMPDCKAEKRRYLYARPFHKELPHNHIVKFSSQSSPRIKCKDNFANLKSEKYDRSNFPSTAAGLAQGAFPFLFACRSCSASNTSARCLESLSLCNSNACFASSSTFDFSAASLRPNSSRSVAHCSYSATTQPCFSPDISSHPLRHFDVFRTVQSSLCKMRALSPQITSH